MHILKYPLLLVVSVFSLLSLQSHAQTSEKTKRLAKVMYYGATSDAPDKAFVYEPGGEPQEVELPRYNFTESFELKKDTVQLAFLPRVINEDEQVPLSSPIVKIPASWDRVLLLILEDKKNKIMPIRILPINASEGEFGKGEICFMNFSAVTVFGKVGDKKLLSKPKSKVTIKDPLQNRGGYMVKLDFSEGSIANRRSLVQQRCLFDPDARVLTLVLPLAPPRLVRLYSAPINDF
ncbi:hypothetical protein [Rubritalea sp.]|uniref:hypothetical protein n=1 Tax=Rubritalea sp. TaxID=2109375 RepID=UPI003EF9D172